MDESVRRLRDEMRMAEDFFTANPSIHNLVVVNGYQHKSNGDVISKVKNERTTAHKESTSGNS